MGCGSSSQSSKAKTVTYMPVLQASISDKYDLGKPKSKTTNKTNGERRLVRAIKKASVNNPEAFIKELIQYQKLDYPNIVRIYEVYDDPITQFIYIVSQFMNGRPFDEVYSTSSFQEYKNILNYIHTIFQTLSYIHSNNLAYRKIALNNLFLDKSSGQEVLMISSFSMAGHAKPELGYSDIKESPLFFPPESHKNGKFSIKSDIWGAGMISFLILTGEVPYKFEIEKQKDLKAKIDFAKLVSEVPVTKELISKFVNLKPNAIEFLAKCLDPNESSRGNASDLLKLPFFTVKDEALLSEEAKNAIGSNLKIFVKSNKIEKELYRFLAFNNELEKDERRLRDFFKAADTSGDGKISKTEMKNALQSNSIHMPISEEEFMCAFNEADVDKSGSLSYSEFVTLFMKKERLLTECNLKDAFKKLDKDGSGFLTASDFQGIKGMDAIIQEIDKSKDGKISVEELISYLNNKKKLEEE